MTMTLWLRPVQSVRGLWLVLHCEFCGWRQTQNKFKHYSLLFILVGKSVSPLISRTELPWGWWFVYDCEKEDITTAECSLIVSFGVWQCEVSHCADNDFTFKTKSHCWHQCRRSGCSIYKHCFLLYALWYTDLFCCFSCCCCSWCCCVHLRRKCRYKAKLLIFSAFSLSLVYLLFHIDKGWWI